MQTVATSEQLAQLLIDDHELGCTFIEDAIEHLSVLPPSVRVWRQWNALRDGIITYIGSRTAPTFFDHLVRARESSLGAEGILTRNPPSLIPLDGRSQAADRFISILGYEMGGLLADELARIAASNPRLMKLAHTVQLSLQDVFMSIGVGKFDHATGKPIFSLPGPSLEQALRVLPYEAASSVCNVFEGLLRDPAAPRTSIEELADWLEISALESVLDTTAALRRDSGAFQGAGCPIDKDDGVMVPAKGFRVRGASGRRRLAELVPHKPPGAIGNCPAVDLFSFPAGSEGALAAERFAAGNEGQSIVWLNEDSRWTTSLAHLVHAYGIAAFPLTLGAALVAVDPRLAGLPAQMSPGEARFRYAERFPGYRAQLTVRCSADPRPMKVSKKPLLHTTLLDIDEVPGLESAADHFAATNKVFLNRWAAACIAFENADEQREDVCDYSLRFLLSNESVSTLSSDEPYVSAVLGHPHLARGLDEQSRLAISALVAYRALERVLDARTGELIGRGLMDFMRRTAKQVVDRDFPLFDGPHYVPIEPDPLASPELFMALTDGLVTTDRIDPDRITPQFQPPSEDQGLLLMM